jgi:hypothetical protein
MKSFTSKLLLSTMAMAIVASPALAQRPHRHAPAQLMQVNPVGTYPNPVTRSGSEQSIQSGAAFNVDNGY